MKSQIEQYFYRCLDTRCTDDSFHFSLLLPEGWKPVRRPAKPPEPGMASTLATFRPVAGPEAGILVTTALLAREMAPADWLDLYLQAIGAVVLERRTVASPGGPVADVLTINRDEEQRIVTRWTVHKDYNRLFLLQAQCLEANYPEYALAFYMAFAGFQLMHPVGWPFAEDLCSFTRRRPGDFCVFYPQSWTLKEDPNSNDHVLGVHILHQVEQAVRGHLCITAVPQEAVQDPQGLVDQFVNCYQQKEVPMRLIDLSPAESVGGFLEAWQGQALVEDRTMELRVTVGRRPDAWFLLAILSPLREANRVVWAVNNRAYEIVLSLFRTIDS